MLKKLLITSLLFMVFSCGEKETNTLELGIWRAELQLTDTEVLPFNFEVVASESLKIFNGEEVIQVDEISYEQDSMVIKMPVFEGYIKAELKEGKLDGKFIKKSLNRVVPFSAEFGKDFRFKNETKSAQVDVGGNWETVFSPDTPEDRYIAKGIFKQRDQKVTGTFRTTTGDYRFLEGIIDGNTLKLSTFDGAHAFLFTAQVTDSSMTGTFYSGNHWQEPFTAEKNEDYELPDANTLTFLKDGYDSLEFNFPNTDGELVSITDERFKDKVVIVQIMGSWCPNCLDESRYYSDFYNNNKNKDLEFVALAFEYAKIKEAAMNNLKRLKTQVGINYPILLAQYGSSSKTEANDKLPMLNHILSYPTSIFIDKKAKVRKIHTGFNGPATKEKFEEFKSDFTKFIDTLLAE